ncbi:MAG: BrnT family toxin [Thiolinea sp.]|mgnify:CR=1 FL=1
MQIQFDPQKDVLNRQKHGVSLAEAENIEWDTLWGFEDDRFNYSELRMIGFGYIGLRLYCVVYTELNEELWRIISLRLATRKEVERYAQA